MGNPTAVKVGPGLLYVAPVGTAEPTAGTGTPASAWIAVGYTEEGSVFSSETNWEDVDVAEELDPIFVLPTSRSSMLSFSMAEVTVRNLAIAYNGGTIGSPTAGMVKFEPPDLGAEQPLAILWQGPSATAPTEALVARRALQTGNIETARNKAPNKALIPVEFRPTIPSDGSTPWAYYGASSLPYTDPH